MKVALVCIAKNEDNYIEEWINYNFKLGFDDIFIYENDWRCSLERENVHKLSFDGDAMQVNAYNDFMQSYHKDYDWVAFFDVDEFLVLKKHSDVKKFINDYRDFYAIGINWVLFGDNGLSFEGNYSVLSRFTKRQIGVNEHVKCIVRMHPKIKYEIHNPRNLIIVDSNFNTFTGPFNPKGDDKIVQLNHYLCKTFDEWENKKNRGRADIYVDHHLHTRPDSDFQRHNFNEIEDKNALNFYYGKVFKFPRYLL